MSRYAEIIPKDGVAAPVAGWRFQFASVWHEIGPGKYFSEEQAHHAQRFFTPRLSDQEPEPMVELIWHEGELTLQPSAPSRKRFDCPLEGCRRWFPSFEAHTEHVKECAQKTAAERAKKDGE